MGSEDAELQAYYPHRDLAYGHIPDFRAPCSGFSHVDTAAYEARERTALWSTAWS